MSCKFDHLYKEELRELVLHEDDPSLFTLRIALPKCPDVTKVEGYGLHPKDQFFKREVLPKRLETANMEVSIRNHFNLKPSTKITEDHYYKFLEENKEGYSNEIAWIKRMIHYRYNGKWCFINGRPYYLNRWNWFYLNQWYVNSDNDALGYAEFRDRDWMWWHAMMFAYTDTKAYYNYRVTYRDRSRPKTKYFAHKVQMDRWVHSCEQENKSLVKRGEAMRFLSFKKESGAFLIDMKYKTCMGVNYPKGRRDGATYRAQCMNYCIKTEGIDRNTGIQSKSDDDAKTVFTDKLVVPWQKLWFFFKPSHNGTSKPAERIFHQKKTTGTSNLSAPDGILGTMDFRSSQSAAYDGDKLYYVHQDEVGKKDIGSSVNVVERTRVLQKCVAQGAGKNIIGFILNTSTLNKASDGGSEFLQVCEGSHYEERDANGQTKFGLINIFIPSYIGLEFHVDEYGFTVVDTPPDPVKGIHGGMIDIGAKDYLLNKRQVFEDTEDWEGLNSEQRMYPIYWDDCFVDDHKNSGFNMKILNERYKELVVKSPPILSFDLEWSNGIGSDVLLVDNPTEGRFRASQLPDRSLWNLLERTPVGFAPHNRLMGKHVAGMDPFKFDNVVGKKSNGAGVVYRPFDPRVDDYDKAPHLWLTDQFTMTYDMRVDSKESYAQDMLKMCILTGSMANPESNVPLINDKFLEWGFGGFLIYMMKNGRSAVNPGSYATEATKNDIFAEYMSYINRRGPYEKHIEIIEQCKKIKSPKQMTNYDLFAAGGWALTGATLFNPFQKTEVETTQEALKLFETYDYD